MNICLSFYVRRFLSVCKHGLSVFISISLLLGFYHYIVNCSIILYLYIVFKYINTIQYNTMVVKCQKMSDLGKINFERKSIPVF